MVWFQCDDCGDTLKKPKVAAHFRSCSASKLSCIDCGAEFDQRSVQQHTQCVSEAAKYGPKSSSGNPQAAASSIKNSSSSKQDAAGNKEEDAASSMGLSSRPPWSCSLCNIKATSKETLEVHGQGKKHKAKARAVMRAAKVPESNDLNNGVHGNTEVVQQGDATKSKAEEAAKQEGGNQNGKAEQETENKQEESKMKKKSKDEAAAPGETGTEFKTDLNKQETEDKHKKKKKKRAPAAAAAAAEDVSNEENGNAKSNLEEVKAEQKPEKKRKRGCDAKTEMCEEQPSAEARADEAENGASKKKKNEGAQALEGNIAQEEQTTMRNRVVVKWKKVISRELKNASDGRLKRKKLLKLVMESYGINDEGLLKRELSEFVNGSSKFAMEGKCIRQLD